jgi:ERCC4-type nuclease
MKIKPRSVKKTLTVKVKKLYHPPIPNNMVVVIDTREQLPYMFPGCRVSIRKLDAGDYSLEGYEDVVSIERKSASDFFGSITQDRDRFERELERLKSYKFKALIIEDEEQNILCPEMYGRGIKGNSVYGSIIAMEIKYGLHVYYGSRERCENKVLNWFIYWMKMNGDGVNVPMEI